MAVFDYFLQSKYFINTYLLYVYKLMLMRSNFFPHIRLWMGDGNSLSRIPKHKKAVMCLMEKICVLAKLYSDTSGLEKLLD